MTITKPLTYPRWATDPPADPAITITEPTEAEKDVGWQRGTQAQVWDVTITSVEEAVEYQFEVDGHAISFTSDLGTTNADIRDGLIAAGQAIPAVDDKVTLTANGATKVRVTAKYAGQTFVLTESDSKLTAAEVTPNRSDKPRRAVFNWWQRLVYEWILWLAVLALELADILADWDVLALGTIPSTGSGLAGDSGVATSYINLARTDGELGPHTFTASRDTYIDLVDDGSWVYIPVVNGADEPALTSNARRQWKVVTDGSDRISAVDMRSRSIDVRRNLIPDLDDTRLLGDPNPASLRRWRGGFADLSARAISVDGVEDEETTPVLSLRDNQASHVNGGGFATFEALDEVEGTNPESVFRATFDANGADPVVVTMRAGVGVSEGEGKFVFRGATLSKSATRAWALVITGVSQSVAAGYGISSITYSGNDLVVHFSAAMPTASYAVQVTNNFTTTEEIIIFQVIAKTTTTFTVRGRFLAPDCSTTTIMNFSSFGRHVAVEVHSLD